MSVTVRGRPLITSGDWYKLSDEVKNILRKWAYKESDQLVVFDLIPDMNAKEVIVNLGYGSKYMEISEDVASGLSEYCAEENLSDEECERLYKQAYRDKLEEINSECVIHVNKEVSYPEKGVKAEIYPIRCDGDYCFCGAGITLRISLDGVRTIEEGIKKVVDATKYAYNKIYSEIIAQ